MINSTLETPSKKKAAYTALLTNTKIASWEENLTHSKEDLTLTELLLIQSWIIHNKRLGSDVIITKKIEHMGNSLYILAILLVIVWAIGFIGYHADGLIHVLLVLALIAILLKAIRGKKSR